MKELRKAERKRRRLCDRARQLTDADLLSVIVVRKEKEKDATATAAADDPKTKTDASAGAQSLSH